MSVRTKSLLARAHAKHPSKISSTFHLLYGYAITHFLYAILKDLATEMAIRRQEKLIQTMRYRDCSAAQQRRMPAYTLDVCYSHY
jgi:hypothetical protein